MAFRVIRFGILGLVVIYLIALGVTVVIQRDLIYFREPSSVLRKPGALAILGSTRVTITTRDGETLAGWYLPPRDSRSPVFLFFHGKGGGLERKKRRWGMITEHGAGILAISYRGYPGSTGTPSEDGLYEDARAAYAWLTEKHDPSQIVLHGLSLGTGVAVKLATEVDARALVLEAPYAALVDVAAARHPYFPVSMLLWDQYRTKDVIGKIKTPILIVHGDKDRVIPVEHAEELFPLAPEPKKMIVVEGGRHNSLPEDGLYPHIWRFLDVTASKSVTTVWE